MAQVTASQALIMQHLADQSPSQLSDTCCCGLTFLSTKVTGRASHKRFRALRVHGPSKCCTISARLCSTCAIVSRGSEKIRWLLLQAATFHHNHWPLFSTKVSASHLHGVYWPTAHLLVQLQVANWNYCTKAPVHESAVNPVIHA